MKIEHADTIALRKILGKIGHKPVGKRGSILLFHSPFLGGEQPSLQVYVDTNIWFDTGTNKGGGVIAFVCEYLRLTQDDYSEAAAKRWLNNIMRNSDKIGTEFLRANSQGQIEIRAILPITHTGLLRYLDERKIDRRYNSEYFREVRAYNHSSGKTFRAVGFRNEDNGFALYNPAISTQSGPYAITFIRGEPGTTAFHVFENIFDFLSVLSARKGNQFDGDVIILNAYYCLDDALAYIKGFGYKSCFLWLENNQDGNRASKLIASVLQRHHAVVVKRMNQLYSPQESLNSWWIERCNLTG